MRPIKQGDLVQYNEPEISSGVLDYVVNYLYKDRDTIFIVTGLDSNGDLYLQAMNPDPQLERMNSKKLTRAYRYKHADIIWKPVGRMLP